MSELTDTERLDFLERLLWKPRVLSCFRQGGRDFVGISDEDDNQCGLGFTLRGAIDDMHALGEDEQG